MFAGHRRETRRCCYYRLFVGNLGLVFDSYLATCAISLAIAALFLPCIEDNIGNIEPTQENITALWDKLETESKQKDHFELDDFSGTKTETMTIWYLYKQMTADATLTDAKKTAAIKSNKLYNSACMLLNGYAKTDSSLSKYSDYWK